MTKYFCDQCGKEIPKGEEGRFTATHKKLFVEVMIGTASAGGVTYNYGNFCYRCVRKAINKGKATKSDYIP